MSRDWVEWHEFYTTPGSSLGRRLEVVRRDLRRALSAAPAPGPGRSGEAHRAGPGETVDGTLRIISICAGDGRDVLPVIAEHDRRVSALLVELDPTLAARARETADDLLLSDVDIRMADAGDARTYAGVQPAHILLTCGVFGNLDADDARRTVAALPALLVPGGIVIWTRAGDASLELRSLFAEHGFTELSFTAPDDAPFRVGMHRLAAPVRPGPLTGRLFTFR
ncbi:class I SAM-dependent methyltransferase family protein [Dactylosporangium sp. NPDC050588]|uniref:class I SAM-dependent methyltransferase family protein n=1 Tax=Dactylosporangium sp. NPDC050588 TaxID=3157211 RepID=UPI0033EFAA1B